MRRLHAPSAILWIALLVPTACKDDATQLQEHIALGDEYVESGRLPEAQIEYRSALQIDPNDGEAHYKLAHAYLRGRKVKEGFWELRETVRLDPKNYAAKVEFAQLALLAGELEEALKQTEIAVAEDPTNPAAYLMRGQALDALKRSDEALEVYRKAVEVKPDDPAVQRALAFALASRGMIDEAESVWHRVLEIDPSTPAYTAYAGFLRRYHRKERLDDVTAALEKAIEVAKEEEQAQAYAQLANFYYNTGREDLAVETLQRGIEQAKDKVDLMYALARLERTRGNREAADALVEQATREKPDDPNVFLFLANYRSFDGDRVGALEAAEKAVELDPERLDSQLRKAEILVEMGYRKERPDGVAEGEKIVQGVLEKEPTNPSALFVQAKIQVTRGQLVDAVASLRAALDARPDWAEAHYLLGATLASQNQLTEARTELGRAVDLDPSLNDANRVLAQVHHRLGENAYAVDVGRRFLKAQPNDVGMEILVAQSLIGLGKIDDALAQLSSMPQDQASAELNYALGRIYRGKNDLGRAREYLLAADAQAPNQADVVENLLEIDRAEQLAARKAKDPARLAAADARVQESLQRVSDAVAAKPDDAKLLQIAGVAAVYEGNLEEAEKWFQKAVDQDPRDRGAVERFARFYAATGRTQRTIEVYEKAIEARPDDAKFHHYLGMLYELNGSPDRAIERYESAIRIDPNLAEAKNNLAFIFAERGTNLDRALDLAKDAKTLLPDNPSVSDTLGWVLFKRGVPSAAISYLKEAEEATSESDASIGQVRLHLALAYEANGDKPEAIAAFERSIAAVESQRKRVRDAGGDPGQEPAWLSDARARRDKLAAATGAG